MAVRNSKSRLCSVASRGEEHLEGEQHSEGSDFCYIYFYCKARVTKQTYKYKINHML
jgi:hypothetical protein